MSVNVLHVIQQLSHGGASQALISLISAVTSSQHKVVSLIPAVPSARNQALSRDIALVERPDERALDCMVREADILQIHFWNTPELYEFMSRPVTTRVLLWSHVSGGTAPHVVTPALASYADALVSSGRPFPDLCDKGFVIEPRTSHTIALSHRLNDESEPFTVGIFGTLESSRSDVSALEIFVAAALPGARLLIVGQGDLVSIWQTQAEFFEVLDNVEFSGFVYDVAAQLRRMDVLLHMPRGDSFATSDLALQEALLAGVVPVVKSGTPVTDLVHHGLDALIASSSQECVVHLRSLFEQPALLARLREQGLRMAHRELHPQTSAQDFENLYQDLMNEPVRTRRLPMHARMTGAERFVASLNGAGEDFRISAKRASGWQEADEAIAQSPPALVGPGAGGILHYRGYYPHDPMMRYWAGLVFAAQGRKALAAAELAHATRAGVVGAKERLDALLRAWQ